MLRSALLLRPSAAAAAAPRLFARAQSNINDAGGAYREREQSAEKEWAVKRDREAIEKLRQQLHAEEAKAVQKHGAEAVGVTTPAAPSIPEFQHDPRAGAYIGLAEFLDFRKEIINKLREVEDEVISLKYQLKQKGK